MIIKGNKATLISRPTKNIVRDYEGDNLLKAFPLQFPYGYGNDDLREDDKMGKVPYYKYLIDLSNPYFQTADFGCIMYNVYSRYKMVNKAYAYTSEENASNFAFITSEEIEDAPIFVLLKMLKKVLLL